MKITWTDESPTYSEAPHGDVLLAAEKRGDHWIAEVDTRAHVSRNIQIIEGGFETCEKAKAAAEANHVLVLTALAEGMAA